MITFILPGYSPQNKDWALDIAGNLQVNHEIRPVLWEHWMDAEKRFVPQKKAEDLIDILKDERANIIAKSIGTLVAVVTIEKTPERINKVVLCGIPTGIFKENKSRYVEALTDFPSDRIIVFQNEGDPYGSYQEIKNAIEEINPGIKVVSKPRSDHNYPYPEDFNKFLKS